MALYLTEDDVARLLDIDGCIEVVEEAFRQHGDGQAEFRPRARVRLEGGILHAMPAASQTWRRMAAKVYATTREGSRFIVLLFDGRTAELLAMIEGDRLGQIRTGAATGVATRHLARQDARTLAVIGTGWQARTQVLGVAAVRRLETILVFGRDPERLEEFCRRTEKACAGVTVKTAASAEEAVRAADIVVTATSSAVPVLEGAWLSPGAHVNAVGSNRPDRRELDSEAVRRADLIVVDSIEQARLEAGDLLKPSDDPAPHEPSASDAGHWAAAFPALDRAVELSAIIAGRHPGRRKEDEISLFESLGVALEDLAAASLVYDLALEARLGQPFPATSAAAHATQR